MTLAAPDRSPPPVRGLTGTPGQVAALAKRFRVYFQEVDREEENDDYLVDHRRGRGGGEEGAGC